jgi:hypothetical protein
VDLSLELAKGIPDALLKELHQELIHGWNIRKVQNEAAVRRRAAFNHSGKANTVEGLGQLMLRVPPDVWHFWEMKLGRGCWSDKGFLNYMRKHNPELFVKSTTKTQVVVQGRKPSGIVDQFGRSLS